MIIDNFEIIGSLIERKSTNVNDFWFLQVIKRRKDNPGLPRDEKLIDNWFIKGKEDLMEKKDRIIEECEMNNARAYFRLNKRNYEKVALQSLRLLAEAIANKNYNAAKNVFLSAAGQFHSDEEKKWHIDIDQPFSNMVFNTIVNKIQDIEPKGNKTIACIGTANGFHIITKPFSLNHWNVVTKHFESIDHWKETMSKIDIHKDNPTLLYFNKK